MTKGGERTPKRRNIGEKRKGTGRMTATGIRATAERATGTTQPRTTRKRGKIKSRDPDGAERAAILNRPEFEEEVTGKRALIGGTSVTYKGPEAEPLLAMQPAPNTGLNLGKNKEPAPAGATTPPQEMLMKLVEGEDLAKRSLCGRAPGRTPPQ